jgi:hypothetical protein
MPPVDRQQVIRERAYAIWEKEGHPDGKDLARISHKSQVHRGSD